jgi:uncharacterized membrane protein YbhN (UPF0104 family)
MEKMNYKSIIKYAVAILLFIIVLYWVGFQSFINSLSSLNLWFFGLAIGVYAVLVTVWATKIYYSYRKVGVKVSFKDAWWINLWGMLGNIFQQAVGFTFQIAASKVLLKDAVSKLSGILIAIQSIEVMMRLAVTAIGMLLFSSLFAGMSVWAFVAMGIIGIIPLLFLIFAFFRQKTPVKQIYEAIPARVRKFTDKFIDDLPPLKKGLPILFGLTLLGWVIRSVEWLVLSYAVGYPLPIMVCLFVSSPLLFTKIVPIPMSLGVYDFSVSYILQFFGMPTSAGVLFAMLDRFDDVFISGLALTKIASFKLNKENKDVKVT